MRRRFRSAYDHMLTAILTYGHMNIAAGVVLSAGRGCPVRLCGGEWVGTFAPGLQTDSSCHGLMQ